MSQEQTQQDNQRNRQRGTRRIGFRWLLLISVLFIELLTYTWIRTESTQTIYRISNAQAELSDRLSYQKELALERDRLKSDARIIRIARNKLGLTTDVFNQTIYIGEGSL